MAKITIIGAGSIVFSATLLNDMFSVPSLAGSEYMLMDLSEEKLQRMASYANKMVIANGIQADVSYTTNRREALKGADYVITSIQVGGLEAWKSDYEIPLKYGVDQCIGDCLNPGGIFRALRTIPVMLGLVEEMEQVCPDAYLLNYVNPLSIVSIAIGISSGINYVGLCHGVQTTLDLISGFVGIPKEEIDFLNAGINHMGWFLKLEHQGKDIYPLFKQRADLPEYYITEKVRIEVMRNFGYFMTESSGHLSDYLPWFRNNKQMLEKYCDQPEFGGESGAAYKAMSAIAEKFKTVDFLSLESGLLEPRSKEYCSYIIEAIETGKPFKFSGNQLNKGYISNLPSDCCAEVPVYADRNGLHPVSTGNLPPQLAALNMTNILVQQLTVQAVLKSDPELAVNAVQLDPLTSSVLGLKEIRNMVIELFKSEHKYLSHFQGRIPRQLPDIYIPAGTKPVHTPVDPALAIANRFSKLANQNIS